MQGQHIHSSANEQYSNPQETSAWNQIKNRFTPKSHVQEEVRRERQPTATPKIYIATVPDNGDKRSRKTSQKGCQHKPSTDKDFLSPTHALSPRAMSKSDQMLNRLLKDQLQLAYSDHQNNVRCAQSYAALEHLRNSQPRLELTPSTSRHASPSRTPGSRHHSPLAPRKSSSPITAKGYEAGSSGSEKSHSSSKSAPPSYLQVRRTKSATPSRTHSPTQNGVRVPRSSSHTNSPSHSPDRAGLASKHLHPSNGSISGASELVKHAHINLLWAFILDAIKSANLEDFDYDDPKQWWRKLFQTLKSMHGKAKASSIAGQLMGNPLVLEAIQDKLDGMIGDKSGYIQSLPPSVRRRIKALKKLQFECTKIEAEFYEEIHKLECKFAEKYSPVYKKRREIVIGEYEPTEEECDWPSEDEDEDEEGGDKPAIKSSPSKTDERDNAKGVSSFWATTFKNVPMLAGMIEECDEPILESLNDINLTFTSDPMGFMLHFEFGENEYFTDKVLTKQYMMRSAPDEEDPFGFEGPEIVSCKGCTIHWKEGKNVTQSLMKKKQKNAKTGVVRTVTKTTQNDSFFNFFSPPEVVEGNEADEETESLLQVDFQIGHFIRERVVPHAVLYFTGELDGDEGEDDEDEDEDSEYDEDMDSDYDPNNDPAAAKDCKQQ